MEMFRLLKSHIDTSEWLKILAEHSEWWDEETGRQNYPGSAHKETKSIILRGPKVKTQEGLQGNHGVENYPRLYDFAEPAMEAMRMILGLGLGKQMGMIMLTKLPSMKFIGLHKDEGKYAEYFDRYHLVIQDGGDDEFMCGEETVIMHTGEFWKFNHQEIHQCSNYGDADRIHLIIDMKD